MSDDDKAKMMLPLWAGFFVGVPLLALLLSSSHEGVKNQNKLRALHQEKIACLQSGRDFVDGLCVKEE